MLNTIMYSCIVVFLVYQIIGLLYTIFHKEKDEGEIVETVKIINGNKYICEQQVTYIGGIRKLRFLNLICN